VAVSGVVISIYYYFGWIKAAFFPSGRPWPAAGGEEAAPVVARVGLAAGTAMVVLAFASVVLGFYQGPVGEWILSR
jgi:NADH-quinone oxidoreductase subunit N